MSLGVKFCDLDVDRAQHVFVIKHGMNPSCARIENRLYELDKWRLGLGNARKACETLVSKLRVA